MIAIVSYLGVVVMYWATTAAPDWKTPQAIGVGVTAIQACRMAGLMAMIEGHEFFTTGNLTLAPMPG